MLLFDLTDSVGPQVLYTSEDYVPACQRISAAGLIAERWWVDTRETYDGHTIYSAAIRPWSPE
ncbi:MAG: hypothetical protein RMJ98_05430 [Myxococcales bacterium]|nr:hypothetical protein [Polyangiaceae bacterium]MDW8248732.1 hypothetical protein [Myxococcales bacterium]